MFALGRLRPSFLASILNDSMSKIWVINTAPAEAAGPGAIVVVHGYRQRTERDCQTDPCEAACFRLSTLFTAKICDAFSGGLA